MFMCMYAFTCACAYACQVRSVRVCLSVSACTCAFVCMHVCICVQMLCQHTTFISLFIKNNSHYTCNNNASSTWQLFLDIAPCTITVCVTPLSLHTLQRCMSLKPNFSLSLGEKYYICYVLGHKVYVSKMLLLFGRVCA